MASQTVLLPHPPGKLITPYGYIAVYSDQHTSRDSFSRNSMGRYKKYFMHIYQKEKKRKWITLQRHTQINTKNDSNCSQNINPIEQPRCLLYYYTIAFSFMGQLWVGFKTGSCLSILFIQHYFSMLSVALASGLKDCQKTHRFSSCPVLVW